MMQSRALDVSDKRAWTLVGRTGQPYEGEAPGTLGGHRKGKPYGLLSCRAAEQAIARGGYLRHRVFFADEATAIAAGYRPCAVCLPDKYATWKTMSASAGAGSCSASYPWFHVREVPRPLSRPWAAPALAAEGFKLGGPLE